MAGELTKPYVGPRPFEEHDETRFFGRNREIAELVALIYSQPQLLLYAESGAGKTSLLQAGVIPALRKKGADILPVTRVRPRQHEQGDLVRSGYMIEAILGLDPALSGDDLADTTLSAYLRRRPRPSSGSRRAMRVLFIDQLEEILVPLSPRFVAEQRDFFRQIADASKSDPLLRVVLVTREDQLSRLETFAPLMPGGLGVRFRIDRLGRGAALAAIREPVRVTPWHFDEGVAERLVEDLCQVRVETASQTLEFAGEFVEPVQLQVVCERLWESLSPGGGIIQDKHVAKHGTVTGALGSYYEAALSRAATTSGEQEWKLRGWFETKLVTPAGTRGIVYRGKTKTEGVSNAAVDVLEEMHLLRGEDRAGSRWYELTHDRMIRAILDSNKRARHERPGWRRSVVLFAGVVGLLAAATSALVLSLPEGTGIVVAKSLVVLVGALAPAWLFVLVVQTRWRVLWDEYVLALFRLGVDRPGDLPEPPISSSFHQQWMHDGGVPDDTSNVYVRKFEAQYGRRILPAKRGYATMKVASATAAPTLLFTLLAAAGWCLVLRPDLPNSQTGLSASAPVPVQALSLAFLGAYGMALRDIVGEYLRGSLTSRTYVRLVARLAVVAAVVVLLDLLLPQGDPPTLELALALVVGIFPEGLLRAFGVAAKTAVRGWVPSVARSHPLSDLDGMTAYYQARLGEEDIEDLEMLLWSNLVDLLLTLRPPLARLVDWLDQAALLVHLPRRSVAADDPAFNLARLGIRTASDLLRVIEAADAAEAGAVESDRRAVREAVAKAIGGDAETGEPALRALMSSIEGEEAFVRVQSYHKSVRTASARASAPGDRLSPMIEPAAAAPPEDEVATAWADPS